MNSGGTHLDNSNMVAESGQVNLRTVFTATKPSKHSKAATQTGRCLPTTENDHTF